MAKKKEEVKQEFKDIASLVDDLRGRFGEGSIMTLGEAKHVDVDVIPTGSFSLDLALGVGGLPQGRIVGAAPELLVRIAHGVARGAEPG